jgi:hypothetical protein
MIVYSIYWRYRDAALISRRAQVAAGVLAYASTPALKTSDVGRQSERDNGPILTLSFAKKASSP